MMRWIRPLVVVLLLMFTLGCAGMSTTQQRTLSGGALGAGAGAGIGALTGDNAAAGAAIGGAAGALGGYLYDRSNPAPRYYEDPRYPTPGYYHGY